MVVPLVCPGCGDGSQLVALEQVVAHYSATYVDDGTGERWPTYSGPGVVPDSSKPMSTGVVLCGRCGKRCLARELATRR
ncbi:hypothetical protein [Pengzhenrongella sp.]|jgi:hypothetical protein|uniref:hypothetical protein n=1 Tax=Pengzhenrongella sp. TaxID=2888820 RepID=UPI002F94D988